MNADMHESLLGQHQRHIDQMAAQDEAEDRAAVAAHAARTAEVAAIFAAGGPAAAELLADHDCAIRDDSPPAFDVLAELARHMAAGSVDAGLASVTLYLQKVAEKEAQSAGLAAMCDVSRIALDGGAA